MAAVPQDVGSQEQVARQLHEPQAAELKLFRMVNVCVRKRAEGGDFAGVPTSSLAERLSLVLHFLHPARKAADPSKA